MFINVSVLTAWTLVSPLVWVRVPVTSNVDSFGRYPDSFGSCYRTANKNYRYVFLIGVSLVDVVALVFANYQSYLARNIPTDLSESFYVALSMAGLLEAYFLGAPILFIVRDNPTAFFLVFSILISIVCLAILLPIFVPKYMLRNMYQRRPARRRGRRASMAMSVNSNKSHDSGKWRQESSSSVSSAAGISKIFRSAEYFEQRRSVCGAGSELKQRSPQQRRRSVAFGNVTIFNSAVIKSLQQSSSQEVSNDGVTVKIEKESDFVDFGAAETSDDCKQVCSPESSDRPTAEGNGPCFDESNEHDPSDANQQSAAYNGSRDDVDNDENGKYL